MQNTQKYGWVLNNPNAENLAELEQSLLINGVNIDPGCMIFKDAYDGKRFDQVLTITNCGKNNVNIRIHSPTSKAFKIKPLLLGRTLPAGLSITRHIKYLYTKPTAIPQACMDIYINNECLRYELLVNTCFAQVHVSPKTVDFGEIDVGMVSDVKTIKITNTGTKQAQYATDLGRNLLQIIVDPMKGTIQPGETRAMTLEIFGTGEGDFNQEFWIKTEPLQRVHIQGRFIKPSLKVDYPMADRNLIILAFPKTFLGVEQRRSIIIQNHSSTSAVICTMGRTENEILPYKEAAEKDVNFKQFYISPLEGRLHRDQKFVMNVMFSPRKYAKKANYYICYVIIDVMKCRADGNPCNTQKNTSNYEISSITQSPYALDTISVASLAEGPAEKSQEFVFFPDEKVMMVLYGEVELPNVLLQPDKIFLNNLKVYDNCVEKVKVLNRSKSLPLILKYNKFPSIEFEPQTILLPPLQPVEVTVKIRPTKMGEVTAKLILDVYYQHNQSLVKLQTVNLDVFYSGEYTSNQKLRNRRKPCFLPGITPKNCNEVGYLVDDVRFNTKIEKPRAAIVDIKQLVFNKNNDALIAFPNEMPKSLRPWKNTVPCKTICAQLPRLVTDMDINYDLTPNEKLLKDSNDSYYLKYIRSLSKNTDSRKLEYELEDYITTNQKRVLMEHFKSNRSCPSVFGNGKSKNSLFVPLTPYEIHNVVVSPKFIQLGRLAADSECADHFNIENKNAFPIHLSIKALYPSIRITEEEFIIGGNLQKNINFVYHSDPYGTHHIPMFIIMNFFHVIDVTVLATIVANTVKCLNKDICIVPTEKTAFLELMNPINSDVHFEMDTKYFHLESFPNKGVIPAKRNMVITVTFNPEVGYMPVKEIAIISESGCKELVEVHFDRKKALVAISSDILVFKDVPLNTEVTQKLIILNKSDQLVPLNIELENSEISFPELTITPTKALIWQKADIVVQFTVKFKEVVEFNVPVNLMFQYEYIRTITIKGNVVYPKIAFKPELIKIPKIPCGSTVTTPFRITNNSEVANYLLFALEDYPEFTIRTKKEGEVIKKELKLAPREKQDFLLEFHPQEAVAYCIYLPYILNGILGPPELNCPDSLQGGQYLSATSNEYKSTKGISISKLKVLKILCAASAQWVRFNTLEIDFSSFRIASHIFEVTNVSNNTQEVCLKLNEDTSLAISAESGNVIIEDDIISCLLDTEESFSVSIKQQTYNYGLSVEKVPIFIQNYSEKDAFNYLKLISRNEEPKFNSKTKSVYFTPTYAGSRQLRTITLELLAHRCNKEIEVNFNCPEIDILFKDRDQISDEKILINYSVIFMPKNDCLVEAEVKFSCPCNTEMSIEVFARSDPAVVINFMSDKSIVEESTYPFFPLDTDTSNYAILMRAVTAIIERWLYSQGYFYQSYYRIPDDIARYPVEVSDENKKPGFKKKTCALLPLVQLLLNLMDTSILKYVDSGMMPSQVLEERIIYNYTTYKNTVSFLKSQGIQVAGLKPEYLLIYEEYVELKKFYPEKCHNNIDDFTANTYYRFSKQMWLILLFHIYKILVLQRIVEPKQSRKPIPDQANKDEQSEFIKNDKKELEDYYQANCHRFPDSFSCDVKILLWLEYHYNRQKTVLWPEENFEGEQYLDAFTYVDDSVSLATVTAAYCPYLKEFLNDIYAFPKNVEQRVHNACRVVQAWKYLKLSFDVHPQTIVTANKIKIIFIVTYLYEVLPHFYPSNDVTIEAPLSESATYNLNVQNCGNVPIQYYAIFFGASSNLFELDCTTMTIPGGKTKTLKLTYFAKRVLDASTILVLSGEIGGQKYAKSVAVTITGVPSTKSSDEIKLPVDIYKFDKKKINLKTPYGKSYRAKIFICFEEPKSFKDLHSVSFLQENFIPREIDFVNTECDFIEKGEATITMTTCFLSEGETRFYLYFCNDDVGDFCVFIKLVSKLAKDQASEINIELPPNSDINCSCKRRFNFNCPKAFTVNIPSKNWLLWGSMQKIAENCFSESTLSLVQKYFDEPMVFRVMKFYLECFPQGFMLSSSLFAEEVEYIISPSKSFSCPSNSFKIADVTSEDAVPLVLHWDKDNFPNEAFLELRSTNEKEIRRYKLIFPQTSNGSSSIGSKNISEAVNQYV